MQIIVDFIRVTEFVFYTYYIYKKMLDEKKNSVKNEILLSLLGVLVSILVAILRFYTNSIISTVILYFLLCILIERLTSQQGVYLKVLISLSICLATFVLSVMISYIFQFILHDIKYVIVLTSILIVLIQYVIIRNLFKIKRFSKGLSFLKDTDKGDYLDIIMINISAIVMLAYCLFGDFYGDVTKQIFLTFIVVSIIMIIMIQKTLTLYYKQKLLHQTIEDYKNEISEKDKKIKELSDEKYKISKLNHEFYNRQKALEKKVADYVSNVNVETANELAITEQIADLSKEYSDKLQNIKHPDKLPTTEIEEIDDMFKYMQSECKKNNIEFKLQINGNIHHMINQIIPKDKLVTLIGDHLRDAIIAINSSNNSFKSIIAILGKADEFYEFCVFDTGIEFELETLLALGTKPITTHKDTGGTGYGFMTTFETLRETKGSLVIEEKHKMSENDYTKAVRIIFDGKAQYRISSYRMKAQNKSIL